MSFQEKIDFYICLILKITLGSLVVSVQQIAKIVNQPVGSIRNAISAGTLPVETFKVGGRRVCTVLALARYLAGKDTPPPEKPKRGRPPKTSKMKDGGV